MLFGLFLLVLSPALVGAAAPSFVGPALLAQHAEAAVVFPSTSPRHPPKQNIFQRTLKGGGKGGGTSRRDPLLAPYRPTLRYSRCSTPYYAIQISRDMKSIVAGPLRETPHGKTVSDPPHLSAFCPPPYSISLFKQQRTHPKAGSG